MLQSLRMNVLKDLMRRFGRLNVKESFKKDIDIV